MDVYKIPVAGLQLLLLIQFTHSFVLLTANIEDVKKLAMKFVSESLADKIATFIAQAAQQMINNPSPEVQKDVSTENKQYNNKQDTSDEFYTDGIVRKKARNHKNDDYRKDDLFHHLAGGNAVKIPMQYSYPLGDDEKQFKSRVNLKEKMYELKFRSDPAEEIKRSNVLSENFAKHLKEEVKLSSPVDTIDDNVLKDDGQAEEKVNFRADDKPEGETHHIQLVATSGDLILTKITTEKPTDDEKKNEGTDIENENKTEKIVEGWF